MRYLHTYTHTPISVCIVPEISLENGWYTRMQIFPLIPRSLFYTFFLLFVQSFWDLHILHPGNVARLKYRVPEDWTNFRVFLFGRRKRRWRVTVVSSNKRMRAWGDGRHLFGLEMRVTPGRRRGRYGDLLKSAATLKEWNTKDPWRGRDNKYISHIRNNIL